MADLSADQITTLKQHQTGPSSASSKSPEVYETEATPLLGQILPTPSGECVPHNGKTQTSPRIILILVGILVLIVQCGDQFQQAPLTRIYESIYCYDYWETQDPSKILIPRSDIGPGAVGGVSEHWCKVAEVQGKVAMLQGTQQFLDCIPSLILSIPVGMLADRWGRRRFILLGFCSLPLSLAWQMLVCWFWQSFQLRSVLFSSLHAFLGGGSTVLSALLFVIISDITDQENRSAVFLKIVSANLVASCICPPIAAYFMTINPWIPMFLALVSLTLCVPIALTVPETLGYQHPTVVVDTNCENDQAETSKPRIKDFVGKCYQPLVESGTYFSQDLRILAIVLMFPLVMINSSIVPLLLQYASTRYSITFSEATLLVASRAGFTIFMFLAIQPWITHFLTKLGMSGQKRDLILARSSAVLMALGWSGIGLAPNTVLFALGMFVATLGNGFPVFIRSFLTGLVEPNKVAELYTAIGIIDTIGLMFAGPIFAWLFERGLELGGSAIGLPFMIFCLGYAAAAAGLLAMHHEIHGEHIVVSG